MDYGNIAATLVKSVSSHNFGIIINSILYQNQISIAAKNKKYLILYTIYLVVNF